MAKSCCRKAQQALIREIPVAFLNWDYKDKLDRLGMPGGKLRPSLTSLMNIEYRNEILAPKDFYVILIEDYYERRIYAWSLVQPWYKFHDIQIYVRPNYRRHSMGTRILNYAKNNHPDGIKVWPHDNLSKSFFESTGDVVQLELKREF